MVTLKLSQMMTFLKVISKYFFKWNDLILGIDKAENFTLKTWVHMS